MRFPSTFQYSRPKLRDTEGFGTIASERFKKQVADKGGHIDKGLQRWGQEALAEEAEAKVYDAVVKAFCNRTAHFFQGMKMESMFQVARESAYYDANQQRKVQPQMFEIDLTTTEVDLYKKLGIDVEKLHNEVVLFVDSLILKTLLSL